MDATLVVPLLALMGVVGAAIITQRSAKTTGEIWQALNGELRATNAELRDDRDHWKQRAEQAEAQLKRGER